MAYLHLVLIWVFADRLIAWLRWLKKSGLLFCLRSLDFGIKINNGLIESDCFPLEFLHTT